MSLSLHNANYRAFVDQLTALRGSTGITQAELARRLGKPQSYISKLERYERRIDPAEFRLVAIALNMDPIEAFAAVCATLEI